MPNLTKIDPVAAARVWDLMEAESAAIEAMLLERISAIPAMAAAFAAMDPNDPNVLAERDRSRALTRRALCDGDWEPYLANLRVEGQRYARMGVPLHDWFSLLDPWRSVLVPAAMRRDEPFRVVLAIDRVVDIAMREIGDAYVLEKEAIAREAEGQKEIYAKLFRSCPLGLTLHRLEPDGRLSVLGMNAAVERLRDTAYADVPDRAEVARRFDDTVRQVLETGASHEDIVVVGPHRVRQFVIKLDDRHAGGIHEDVTEKERTTRALRRSNADLLRSNQDLDEFAYVASHDLRAPLRDIENLASWLKEDLGDELPPSSLRHITRLRERVARMERLLEDLLQYSRAGRRSGEGQAVDLTEAVASAVGMAGVPSSFSLEVSGPPLRLHSPRTPLELVLRNLVMNAVKHHHAPPGHIRVAWQAEDGFVTISVADDGPGVPREYQDRIFKMFQTLKPRDAVEGSGMGLAIVRRVVVAHGGTVRVESSGDGQGSVFSFSWPLWWKPDEQQAATRLSGDA